MIRWIKKTVMLGIAAMTVGTNALNVAYADDVNAGVGYSVQKVSPENEVDSSSSYYDLLVTPGETRTIEAKLINPSDEEITIESSIFAASTNSNGEINYTSEPDEFDKSLTYKLSDIAEIAASDIKTTLAPNSEETISLTIEVPEDMEEGVILGSWYFEKLGQEAESDDEDETGIVINNKYTYAMAIKLTVNEEIADPNLNLLNVTTGLNNYHKVINANLQNDQAAIVSNLTISAQIFRKGQYDVLYENEAEQVIMAPNSNFAFPIYLGDAAMVAGDYTLKLTATSDDPKWESETWEWTQDFTITSDEANRINEEAINDDTKTTNWMLYIVIALSILVIILLIVLLLKKRKDKEDKGE